MRDVIVIGAGPAGSRVAHKIAESGYKVLVLEKKKHLEEPVCCTGIIGQECIRRFDIDENVIYRRANGAKVYSPGNVLLKLLRPDPQASIVDRSALNLLFANRALNAGAEYSLNSQVVKINNDRDCVTIEIKKSGDSQNSFQARAVVIATGFNPSITKNVELGTVGDYAFGSQVDVESAEIGELEVYFGKTVAPGLFAWLVPTSPGHAKAGLLSRARPNYYLEKLLKSLKEQGKITEISSETLTAGVSLKPLSRTYSERLLVVGSAAGQVKPITAGGVYYSLLCADLAADSLLAALKSDNLSVGILARYEKEWKKLLERDIRIGYWGRQFYEVLSDRQVDRLFEIIRSNGIEKMLQEEEDLSFDWHGKAVMRLIRQSVLTKAVGSMKLPLSFIKK